VQFPSAVGDEAHGKLVILPGIAGDQPIALAGAEVAVMQADGPVVERFGIGDIGQRPAILGRAIGDAVDGGVAQVRGGVFVRGADEMGLGRGLPRSS
jgi:hypothetical protein